MGFSNVTGNARRKRPGCETKKARDKRKKKTNDAETAQDVRVTKKQSKFSGDREPEQLAPAKTDWEKKVRALTKKNDSIKALRTKKAAGEELDDQQEAKLATGDEVLLALDDLLKERPRDAEAFARAREDAKTKGR